MLTYVLDSKFVKRHDKKKSESLDFFMEIYTYSITFEKKCISSWNGKSKRRMLLWSAPDFLLPRDMTIRGFEEYFSDFVDKLLGVIEEARRFPESDSLVSNEYLLAVKNNK